MILSYQIVGNLALQFCVFYVMTGLLVSVLFIGLL